MKKTPKRTPRKKASTRGKTNDAVGIIDRMIGKDKDLRKLVERATLNARVAQIIYDARTAAGLTQRQLAARVGSTQSVIARLEDADYGGHSLSMLQRIAAALDQQIDVKLVGPTPKRQAV